MEPQTKNSWQALSLLLTSVEIPMTSQMRCGKSRDWNKCPGQHQTNLDQTLNEPSVSQTLFVVTDEQILLTYFGEVSMTLGISDLNCQFQ